MVGLAKARPNYIVSVKVSFTWDKNSSCFSPASPGVAISLTYDLQTDVSNVSNACVSTQYYNVLCFNNDLQSLM